MRFLFALTLLSLGLGAILYTSQPAGTDARRMRIWTAESAVATPISARIVVDHTGDPEGAFACTNDPQDCTLRSAIERANKDGVPTEIRFTDHMIIELTRPLPPLVENGTDILAELGKEVHVDGNGVASPLFEIAGSNMRIEGLRLYGSGTDNPVLAVRGALRNVTIARNIIGDDDAPQGNCGQSDSSSAGIYVSTEGAPNTPQTWITSNIIECIGGRPGVGVLVEKGSIIMGAGAQGRESEALGNVVRFNQGHGIYLGANGGNVIANNLIYDNRGDGLAVSNFNNDITGNTVQ